MQEDVDEMVTPCPEAAYQVVEAEGEDAQWPVGAVRATVGQRRSPEIVHKEAWHWSRRQDILVAQDRTAATNSIIKVTISPKM